ncbi:OmpA family protein [Vibrio nigripulchritudo]|uniref:OmpA family protein n=1 Tax=Vibrio nigripulchritudo TaxID=28173 RepID=UPI0003B1B726|nr:OmpA family protein [Vibrio nigripulchritudo]CCN71202.1 putative Outer membrane protein, OmpA/MotB [Vibrio nigripulchritudo SFn118]
MKTLTFILLLVFCGNAAANCLAQENTYLKTTRVLAQNHLGTQTSGRLLSHHITQAETPVLINEETEKEQFSVSKECIYDRVSQTLVLNYEFDKDKLSDDHKHILLDYMNLLDKSVSIAVEGHADEVGTEAYNAALSQRRASNVSKFLKKTFGNEKQVVERAYGETAPICEQLENKLKGCNRRVVLTVQS